MYLLKRLYEKIYKKPAPYYYDYSLATVLMKPLRKWLTVAVAPYCPFNCVRIAIYRLCGFKIGKRTFIGMRCYLDDMCYDLLTIGDDVIISYGVYFACHGRNQGHYPIVVSDGAYIGMRASVISKNNSMKMGGGYDNRSFRRCRRQRLSEQERSGRRDCRRDTLSYRRTRRYADLGSEASA